jgi:hypothetical protein
MPDVIVNLGNLPITLPDTSGLYNLVLETSDSNLIAEERRCKS